MKKILLLSLLVFATSTVFAQEEKTSTVKLKSGIKVEGQIIEKSSDGSIKVKTRDGDVFVYRANEISRIETEDEKMLFSPKAAKKAERGLGNFKGYKGIVELGGIYDFDWLVGGAQFTFINGYNFGAHCFLGVGVGVNYIGYGGGESIISVPVFLNVRTPFIKNTRVSPFFGFSAGYNITVATNCWNYNTHEDYKSNGVYIEPMLGLDFRINRKQAVTFAVSAPIVPASGSTSQNIIGVAAKLGFSF